MAKADDPTTWGTRAEAETRAAGLVNEHGGGIGIELGDLGGDSHVCGLDLDACLNQQTCAAWAEAIIAAAPTYGEISPSGTGLKLYFYVAREDVRPFLELIGVLAEQWGCRRAVPGHDGRDHGPAIEVYLSYRYFAVTGRRWPELPDKIVLFDWAALQRLAELVPPPRQTGAASGATGDNSRSAAAFRIACAAKSRGGTYEEMVEQLRRNPETSDWVCEKGEACGGRELRRLWDRAAGSHQNATKPQREIQLIDFEEIEARLDWTWLVEGLLMPEQISVAWGLPGCRKTFMCLDIALHVAANLAWLGRRVEPRLVVYIAAEAGNTIRQRVAAWKIEHGYKKGHALAFAVVPHAVDLCHATSGDLDALMEKICQQAGDQKIVLVVVDTVNRALGGGNENGPEDMGAFSRSLDRFRDEMAGCHVLAVHHCGKNPSLGARGHSLLIGNVDTEAEITANETTKTSTVRVHKQRDAEPPAPFSFGLKPVILGTNQVGQIITSCIVVPVEEETVAAQPAMLSKAQRRALELLTEAINKAGDVPPVCDHIPSNTRCVAESLWRDYCYKGQIANSDKPDSQRQAFGRAAETLLDMGRIGKWGDLVWITR